ncbi:MAG: hypothetical protein IT538_08040 [Variibacter sp.]|nr:hypothetical protein [Variibacter sp.]
MANAFPRLDGLVRLSHSEGVDIRRPLLRVLTDLYVQELTHSREEEQQYVELTLRLLPAVDVATRAAVARKLADYALTPTPIVETLLQDVAEVSEPIREAVARAMAATRGHGHGGGADEAQALAPIETDEAVTVDAVSQPQESGEMGERFLAMDSAERTALLDRDDTEEFLAFERLQLPARPGAERRLERAALQTNPQEFARELRFALGVSTRVASRIAQDETGEALLVAACALDISREVLLRILLFLNPTIGHSVERVFALYRLYPRLSQEAVLAIMASWRKEAAARTGRHQPVHADGGARTAPSAREGTRPAQGEAAPGRQERAADPRKRA